ncbi:hypothetical protein ABZX66_21535 [Micromonospora aurantiaca]|uniref:hypothetical protein n=1 Tax=Micromonospora aurantiaca (nom. illeg.) TaxID=47850 RepID=UPI0033ACD6D4
MSATDQDLLERLDLDSLVLDECQIVRGEAENARPGKVDSKIDVAFSKQGNIVYTVESQHSFMNADGELLVRIDASFAASYTYEGAEPDDDQIAEYAQTALMIQVLPFMREFLASMTNRLGLAPFYLPLFRNRAKVLARPRAVVQ